MVRPTFASPLVNVRYGGSRNGGGVSPDYEFRSEFWSRSCLCKIQMGSMNAYSKAAERVQCLDMLWLESLPGAAKPFHDCGILLEVWVFGGLLQMNTAMPEDTLISIPLLGKEISAKVVSCKQDDYGFLVQLAIAGPGWFPESYTPPYILSPQHENEEWTYRRRLAADHDARAHGQYPCCSLEWVHGTPMVFVSGRKADVGTRRTRSAV